MSPDATGSAEPSPSLAADLRRPEAYATAMRPERVELAQTHISWVFLLERDVFKVKKPVGLSFLDFRTLEQRKSACEAEVRLNARLAPGVYLGVEAVRRGGDGRGCLVGDGEIVDWAVHMKRMPDDERADVLLTRGALDVDAIDRIATRLASFHAEAPSEGGERFGDVAAITTNVEENFSAVRDVLVSYLTPSEAEELVRWQRAFLRGQAVAFEARVRRKRVREGHGDLRLEHVYLRGEEVTVLDCIEFNERFRIADVCADVAFLSMDLAGHGRVDLAERLLAVYARESQDFDLYALVDFYESYRAFVRAKIATMMASDESADHDARARATREARAYFRLALSADRRPVLMPSLVAVGGVIASGKSTVADRIGMELGAPVIDADRARKAMLDVPATRHLDEGAWKGAYDPAFTEKVYAEVLRRADVVLASGRPVVIDASFRSPSMRAAARELAIRHSVPFRFVECRASRDVCRARLVEREKRGGVSDGRLAIFDDFVARWEQVTELPATEHVVLDTTRPIDDSLARVRTMLDTWPKGFG